jgi:hypothetical protein
VPKIRPGQVEATDVPPLLDEALVPLASRFFDLPVVRSRAVRHDRARREVVGVVFLLGCRLRSGRFLEYGPLLEEVFFQREREVAEQVPAVCHVRRAGSALRQPFPVDVRTVSARHLHLRSAGVALEPGHEALLGTLRQQIHDLMALEIDEDSSIRTALLESEVVHAENPDLTHLRQRRGFDPPQKCVTSGDDTQLQGQPGTRSAAEFEGDRQQSLLKPVSLTGARTDLGQPLAEDLSLARRIVAEEAASTDLESHRDPVPGQVRGGA